MHKATHIIVSDLHVGSPYFRREAFLRFLEQLPDGAELILNGDTLDDPGEPLSEADREILDRISELSGRRSVVWLRGNHDWDYEPDLGVHGRWDSQYLLDNRVLVAHGDCFDRLMPHCRLFINWFQKLYRWRQRRGKPSMHVAEYARNWAILYRFLRWHVMGNALSQAGAMGCGSVVCGHVHYAEQGQADGVDYFNTGTWTGAEFWYVQVTKAAVQLLEYSPS
jgi:UDP-2,3-diacylglucosamine pyrophosphatase LpxH